MRIVQGVWAGQALTSPGGRVRPTTEQTRDACLTMVAKHLAGARVLELFAGSGALGLEALSRGASTCDFVENDPAALHALKANVAAFRLRDRVRVFKRDAIPFVERIDSTAYDIALADPPYGSLKLDRIVTRWNQRPFSRILVLEHAVEHEVDGRRVKRRRVGDSMLTILEIKT